MADDYELPEINLSAQSTDVCALEAIRRFVTCAQAIARTSSAITDVFRPVHIPVCAIPATTTTPLAAWLQMLMPSFTRSCPVAKCLNLDGCDGCQHCWKSIGYHIRLYNLGIVPPRNFNAIITKNILSLTNYESVSQNYEISARMCEYNREPPEVRSVLYMAVPYNSDITELYVYTGFRWILRKDWRLSCRLDAGKQAAEPPSTPSPACAQEGYPAPEGTRPLDEGTDANQDDPDCNPQPQKHGTGNQQHRAPSQTEGLGDGAGEVTGSRGLLARDVRKHHRGSAATNQH